MKVSYDGSSKARSVHMRTLEANVYRVLVDSLEAPKRMSNGIENGVALLHILE